MIVRVIVSVGVINSGCCCAHNSEGEDGIRKRYEMSKIGSQKNQGSKDFARSNEKVAAPWPSEI